MTSYSLIAFKPSSSDMCRGCVMAEYPEDLRYFANLNQDELINRLAEFSAFEPEHGESEYRIVVTAVVAGNTFVLYDSDGLLILGAIDFSSEDDYRATIEIEKPFYDVILPEVDKRAKEIVERRKQEKIRQEELKKQEEIAKQKARDLAELERLQKLYKK